VGDKIGPLLKKAAPPSQAAAQVCDGHYWLLWQEELYLLSSGEESVWHRFRWPNNGTRPLTVCRGGQELRIAALRDTGDGDTLFWFSPQGDTDTAVSHTGQGYHNTVYTYEQRPVTGMVCTKSYDFGAPETFKSVLGIAVETAGDVTPGYVTERHEQTDRPHRAGADGLIRMTPNISRCRRLALRLTGEGLTLGGVTLCLRGGMR
jgi:hypothetical protein